MFGPRFDSHRGSGGAAGFQSGLNRTLAGLESALAYSRSAGKGKRPHGRSLLGGRDRRTRGRQKVFVAVVY